MRGLIEAARRVAAVFTDRDALSRRQQDALDRLRAELGEQDGWEPAGLCVVETGFVMLIDPEFAEDHLTTGWYDRNIVEPGPGREDAVRPISFDGKRLGVLLNTAAERGAFPVEVRYTDRGVAEVRITFEEEA